MYTMPVDLAARPMNIHWKLPIPFTAEAPDGTHSFVAIDATRVVECAMKRLCGACGKPLDYWIAFIGGPISAETRRYADPPMHVACAEAVMTLCPHIALKRTKRACGARVPEDAHMPPGFNMKKPDRWIIGITRDFDSEIDRNHVAFLAFPFKRTREYVYNNEGRLTEVEK